MLHSKVELNNKKILVTGAAGFIGANLVMELLSNVQGATIVGIDNLNDYYDVSLKEHRLKEIEKRAAASGAQWVFVRGDIADKATLEQLFREYGFCVVVNLAAQAGVRYSIENPDVYISQIFLDFTMFWSAAAIGPWSIWCMPPAPQFMAAMRRCPTAQTTRWITPSACMRPPKRAMS